MILKSNVRIVNYLMHSDFKTPVTVSDSDGNTFKAVPKIHAGRVGVVKRDVSEGTVVFYPAGRICRIEG